MKALLKGIDWFLRWGLILLASVMIITVTWQVFSRYILKAPSSLTEEIARFQLIWLGLLGAVYTFRNRMHVGIDILVTPLTGRRRFAAELLALISCLVFAVFILIYGGGKLVQLTHELNQTSAALGVRMSYVYSVLPLSGILIALYALQYIFDVIFRGKIHKPSEVDSLELNESIQTGT
jgi:TRAP-type C4-dicarboxylate transport system permease small subunit